MHAVRLAALVAALSGATTVQAAGLPPVGVIAGPAVACPSRDAVQTALSRLRGRPAVESAPAHRLFIERMGDQLHVELRDGADHILLVRELQVSASDCEHAAQAIALIVERHFRALDWSPSVPSSSASPGAAAPRSPPPLPAPANSALPAATAGAAPAPPLADPAAAPEEVSATPAPTAPPAIAVTAAVKASPPTRPALLRLDPVTLPRLVIGVGPAFWSRDSTFAIAVGGRWRVLAGGPFEIGLGTLLPPLQASAPVGSGGSAHVTAVPLAGSLGLAAALGRLATGAHVGGMLTIEHGRSEAIPDAAAAWRTMFALGLGISAAWPIMDRLRLMGSLDGYRTVLGQSYAIAGVSGAVLEPAPWQLVAVLGAEVVISP